MGKVNNYCRTCIHFTQYYKSGLFNYWSHECGFCDTVNDIVNENGTCISFCKRPHIPIKVEEIDRAIDDVEQIEKLLKE